MMRKKNAVIVGKDVAIGYSGKQEKIVCQHLNFELYKGELTCLLGANGAGKSTLLRTLAVSQPLLKGQLELMGMPVGNYSVSSRSRLVGVVLTDRTQTGGLTVRELVALGRQPHTGFFGHLNRHDREVIDYALEAVGILHKAMSYVGQLSDGERQKAMIAKVLVQECPLILLDEPTAFLDVVSRIEIMNLLRRLAVEENKAILMSTHDVEQALVLSDRLWLLAGKDRLECGVTEDIILSGKMDGLFDSRSHICFDLMHGVFSPQIRAKGRICLKAFDETLRHWAQNALNRHGYLCMEQAEGYACSQLEVLAPHRLIFKSDGLVVECTSFEELVRLLDK